MRDTLLLACGSQESRAMLSSIFQENYNLLEGENSKQSLLLLNQNIHCIAAVLLDLTVPDKGGHTLLEELTGDRQLSEVPILVILNESSQFNESTAFRMGADDVKIANQDNRSRTVWLLLAYLLFHRNRPVPQDELIGLLYGNDPKGSNPANSLKTALYRAAAGTQFVICAPHSLPAVEEVLFSAKGYEYYDLL